MTVDTWSMNRCNLDTWTLCEDTLQKLSEWYEWTEWPCILFNFLSHPWSRIKGSCGTHHV